MLLSLSNTPLVNVPHLRLAAWSVLHTHSVGITNAMQSSYENAMTRRHVPLQQYRKQSAKLNYHCTVCWSLATCVPRAQGTPQQPASKHHRKQNHAKPCSCARASSIEMPAANYTSSPFLFSLRSVCMMPYMLELLPLMPCSLVSKSYELRVQWLTAMTRGTA